jgi:phosphate:Na+ symporter
MLAAVTVILALILLLGGINSLSSSLKAMSGGIFHHLLKSYTEKSLQGFSLGMIATFFLQSSSAVSVIVIGFINGGIFTLRQGLYIIIGANVGTTLTSQFFSLELRSTLLPIIVGGVFLCVGENIFKKKLGGNVLLSLGVLLAGIELLVYSLEPLTSTSYYQGIYLFSRGALWKGILTGVLAAGMLQSSSVTAGMVVLMARENLLNLPDALAIVLGADLGTCVTSLVASIGTVLSARRLALGHVFFNFLSILLVMPLWPYFISVVELTASEPGRQVANAHLLYNLLGAVVLLPMVDFYVELLSKKNL